MTLIFSVIGLWCAALYCLARAERRADDRRARSDVDEARGWRASVNFSRRVFRLRNSAAVLEALEEALRSGIPEGRFSVLSADALEQTAKGSATIAGDQSVAFIPLRTEARPYGIVFAPTMPGPEAKAHAELLCRVAMASLRNLELHEASIANERLLALGRLAAGVAHEMNNPLAYLLANVRTLEDSLEGPLHETAREASHGAERLARIVRDLSSLSRGGPQMESERFDAMDSVRRVVREAEARHSSVRIVVDGPRSRLVRGDAVRIEQALINVVGNALDAVAGRVDGRVRIAVTASNGPLQIAIEDNGPGVPEAHRDRLFDAFFTTKRDGGTGLGLFLSRTFVEAHGGRLELARSDATGSTFRMTFPASMSLSGEDVEEHSGERVIPQDEGAFQRCSRRPSARVR